MSGSQYSELLEEYGATGKTTGPNQSESLLKYTKLNAHRSKRIAKTVTLDSGLVERLKSLDGSQTWLIITESWCGDAANSVPVLSKLAEQSDAIDLRLVLRDDNPELMDEFLTNGGRSIPKLIALDKDLNVLFSWGPRPAEAQKLYSDWKNAGETPYDEFQLVLQKWYNTDGGKSLQEELMSLI